MVAQSRVASSVGPIDDSAREAFRGLLHPLVEQSGTKVLLDLSQSNFITSTGIGQLVALVANANTNSSRVVLAACTSFVSIALNRCKLNKFFEMADSVPEAIRLLLDK